MTRVTSVTKKELTLGFTSRTDDSHATRLHHKYDDLFKNVFGKVLRGLSFYPTCFTICKKLPSIPLSLRYQLPRRHI